MATVYSFAEESCWDGNQLRPSFPDVVFQFVWDPEYSERTNDFEFTANFGLWYDPQDSRTVETLSDACPGILWDSLIFHKKLDHSGIDVIDTLDDAVIATISVRRGKSSGEIGENVVIMSQWLRAKEERERGDNGSGGDSTGGEVPGDPRED